MGSTHQSSVDLGFVFPLPEKKLLGAGWRERSRPEASPRRSTRFDWLQEMLRWQSVIPEESHNYLDIYWKSAAERVNSAAKVVQEQSSRRAALSGVAKLISDNLPLMKQALAESRAGIQKAYRLPHVGMAGCPSPLPRSFAL